MEIKMAFLNKKAKKLKLAKIIALCDSNDSDE